MTSTDSHKFAIGDRVQVADPSAWPASVGTNVFIVSYVPNGPNDTQLYVAQREGGGKGIRGTAHALVPAGTRAPATSADRAMVNVRMPRELWERAQQVAASRDETVPQVVRRALTAYIKDADGPCPVCGVTH